MFTVIVETRKDGEDSTGQRAFLAHVRVGADGALDREYALEVVDYNNRRALAMLAEPCQIFAACRWRFNGERFTGGEMWFTIDPNGAVVPLEEQEAITFLSTARNTNGTAAADLSQLRQRTPPTDVFCRRNDIISPAPPARPFD